MSAIVEPKQSYDTSHITEELFRRETAMYDYTPDFMELRLNQKVLVMLYDSFRPGGINSESLVNEGVIWLGAGKTAVNAFRMFKTASGEALVRKEKKFDARVCGQVYGDIFAVSPETILALDAAYMNTESMERGQHYVFCMDQAFKTTTGYSYPSVPCYMYLAKPDFWEGVGLVEHVKFGPSGREYYDFDAQYHKTLMNMKKAREAKTDGAEVFRSWTSYAENAYGSDSEGVLDDIRRKYAVCTTFCGDRCDCLPSDLFTH